MGEKSFKMVLLLQIAAGSCQTAPGFPSHGPHKTAFGIFFYILSCGFFTIVFRKYQIHHCSLWRNQKPQLSGKWANVEQNWVKFGHRGKYSVYEGYCWQLSAWSHSGVTRCISDFRQPCISKIAGRRAKRGEIWSWGWVFSVYSVLSTVKFFRLFWGHLVYWRFSTTLCLDKGMY